MAINSTHPFYALYVEDWRKCRDSYKGQTAVKRRRTMYLPPTEGMRADGMEKSTQEGYLRYNDYLLRATYYEFVSGAVEYYLGLLHQKPANIELPEAMQPLLEAATENGESLQHLLRRINEQQLVTGRLGLLLDMPSTPAPDKPPMPYIALYVAEAILNWDDGTEDQTQLTSLNLVVLDESGPVRVPGDFTWQDGEKYRVLILGQPDTNEPANTPGAVYRQAVKEVRPGSGTETSGDLTIPTAEQYFEPQIRGKTLNRIPFVFINSKDIVARPDDPPLLGLVNLALTIYRGDADYRQNLHYQGQDTLVIIGANSPQGEDPVWRTGAGVTIELDEKGDAKYIGPSADGLPEQRTALENDKLQAANMAGQLIDTRSGEKESGEALKQRVTSQTATLNQLALAGALALQQLLRTAAEWMGADPEQVKVTPNLEFGEFALSGEDLVKFMTARSMGLPFSLESMHNLMVDRGLTKLTFEEEKEKMAEEAAAGLGVPTGTDAGGNPDDNEDEDAE